MLTGPLSCKCHLYINKLFVGRRCCKNVKFIEVVHSEIIFLTYDCTDTSACIEIRVQVEFKEKQVRRQIPNPLNIIKRKTPGGGGGRCAC